MKFQPPKGTRDLLSEDASKLQRIIEVCRSTFEKYGFQPLITPAFESFELLSAKGGLGEAVKDEIYYFKDKSDRELGLRFDLTMPLARVVSSISLPKPFKRYAIDKVWRYDNPASLRFREFFQCDIDTLGSKSLLADAEILACACECLDDLGFKKYYIRVNNRKLLQEIFEKFVDKNQIVEAFRTIDKLDKTGLENVKKELENKRIKSKEILEIVQIKGSNSEILSSIKKKFGKLEGLKELDELLKYSETFGIKNKLKIDLSLVRGLEYYTSVVFEVFLGAKVSCGGGGRYDNLIEAIGGQSIPASGISFGLDRILEVMKQNKMFVFRKSSKVFVASITDDLIDDVVETVQELRKSGISSQVDLMNRNLNKQLGYANSLGIPYTLIVGKEELGKNKFKLKDMKKGVQKNLTLKQVISLLK